MEENNSFSSSSFLLFFISLPLSLCSLNEIFDDECLINRCRGKELKSLDNLLYEISVTKLSKVGRSIGLQHSGSLERNSYRRRGLRYCASKTKIDDPIFS